MKLFASTSPRTANALKFAALGMTLTSLAVVIIVLDPLKMIVDWQLTLKPGTLLYHLWRAPPLELFISVYVFNVTNLDAFVQGIDTKLKVEEVGPYVYQEMLTNQNVTFNANDTVTFRPVRQVKFRSDKSIGDPMKDMIIAPNIPYMGATAAASTLSTIAALGVSALTRQIGSKAMLHMSVHEYLWGYEDHLVSLASRFVPSFINFERFGILERIFNEGENMVTMKLPSKNKKEPQQGATGEETELPDYALDTWNGGKTIKFWTKRGANITNCNGIRGAYDVTLFPRSIKKGQTFRFYRKAFCRTLPMTFTTTGKIDGIDAYHFELDDKAFDSNWTDVNSSCFCTNKKCLKKGLASITPCYYNIPLAISFPHFLNADPSLLEPIEGLSPNKEKHGSNFALQPQLGIPMRAIMRFQVNLMVDDIKFSRDMTRFRNKVLPLVWLEIAVHDLTPGLKFLTKSIFNICPYLQYFAIVAFFVGGLALVATSMVRIFRIPTSTLTSTAAKVATTLIPVGSNNGSCNKMLALAEETKKKARQLQKAHVNFSPLLPLTQIPLDPTRGEEQEQLLEMEPELGEQQELLDMEMEMELELAKRLRRTSTTFTLPEFMRQ
ncbi:scavenger receptor class B member 1 [Stomoxys calcitrans]|uniref:scavenger receptor class B member 1 n=1 Tax=Stomoxys calcitrans TaxID=35570 RepID=UPI0027E28FF7|nr:scavenger receptor class B member 1 [Stomoxys calcitrans]